jgi:hypothetical protein
MLDSLFAPATLAAIHAAFDGSSVIVEHRIRSGGRRPDSLVFDDFADFEDYLREHARPGDNFAFWRYKDVCRPGTELAFAQFPDAQGKVFEGGAY